MGCKSLHRNNTDILKKRSETAMIKDYTKEDIKEFINGCIYHFARLFTLYLAAFYFTVCRGDLEW